MLTAKLTPEAYDGWAKTAHEMGVSTTALLEAVGRNLADPNWSGWMLQHEDVGDLRAQLAQLAREIDAERRTRRQ
jgi:hypothetical protein